VGRINAALQAMAATAGFVRSLIAYQESARRAREALESACRCLEAAMNPSASPIARLATIAEAKVLAQPSETDVVKEAALRWRTFADMWAELGKEIPVIQPDLTIDALTELQQRFAGNLERVVAEASAANPRESSCRLAQFTEMTHDTQTVNQRLAQLGEEKVASIGELNSAS
jgi:hypothetical protein